MHGVGPLARPVPVLGNPAGRQVGGLERGIADDVAIERQGRLDAPDLGLVEGPAVRATIARSPAVITNSEPACSSFPVRMPLAGPATPVSS